MENYFELLNLEVNYQLDKAELKTRFLQRQIQIHPDRAKNPEEQHLFLEKSIMLNKAKQILLDDYLRAEYLLKLAGIEMELVASQQAIDHNYLEKIVESNEQITSNQDIDFLKKIKQEKEEEKKLIINQIQIAFDNKNLSKALELTICLKYLTNLVKNIDRNINCANYQN